MSKEIGHLAYWDDENYPDFAAFFKKYPTKDNIEAHIGWHEAASEIANCKPSILIVCETTGIIIPTKKMLSCYTTNMTAEEHLEWNDYSVNIFNKEYKVSDNIIAFTQKNGKTDLLSKDIPDKSHSSMYKHVGTLFHTTFKVFGD